MSQLTVAYDARFLQPKTRHWGVGVVIDNLIKRLRADLAFVGLSNRFRAEPADHITFWPSVSVANRLVFEFSPLFIRGFDVYWATAHFSPQFLKVPSVFTFHDMLLLNKIESSRKFQRFFVARFRSSLAKAAQIVAVSKTTADELISEFPNLRRRVEVVRWGYDAPTRCNEGSLADDTPHGRFAIVLGSHRPRKNLGLAVATIRTLRDQGINMRLLVTGDVHPSFREVIRECPEGLEEVGVLPKEKMFDLLGRAVCVLFPSRYEGFGFPLLEAMAAACPVLALDIPINREIAGEAACLLPEDPIRWAAACRQILEAGDFRDEMKGRGFENLKRFSWDKAAVAYRQIFMKVARC